MGLFNFDRPKIETVRAASAPERTVVWTPEKVSEAMKVIIEGRREESDQKSPHGWGGSSDEKIRTFLQDFGGSTDASVDAAIEVVVQNSTDKELEVFLTDVWHTMNIPDPTPLTEGTPSVGKLFDRLRAYEAAHPEFAARVKNERSLPSAEYNQRMSERLA